MTAVLTEKDVRVGQDNQESTKQPISGFRAPPLTTIKDLAKVFKLLADETRLKILYILHQTDELNVLELCKLLKQRQPSVSHHLALLRVAGLIGMRRDGKHNYYRLLPERFDAVIRIAFAAEDGKPSRICFEDFELLYTPTSPSA